MAVNHYFSHTTPDGKDIFIILDEVAYPWATAGENLFLTSLRDPTAVQQAVDYWSVSPSHATNMYSPIYDEMGIGIAEGDEGVYVTLVMGKRF